uniref:Fignl1 interacting regulator of recombination and mitosis n=1 Tax=Myripristis murdjan TaxID=586833 RepID=A0A667Y607_9TELE
MSQTTLLEEVLQWSQDTCRQELKSVLPKLTISSLNWDDHIRILKIITDMFLPHIGLSELENECFSKVLPKVAKMFDKLLEEISNQVAGLSSQNTEVRTLLRNILQAMVQIIDALSTCVRHVCSFEEAPDLDAIRSLPSCILKVLRDTFQHCKESEVVYCGRLSLVADLLQGLFREAYSLQKGLMEMLDRMSLNSNASEEEVSDIVTVIHSLLDICSIISNLDIALHANTWRFIIKSSLKHQSLVEEHLRHGDISRSLCDNLLASFSSCLELAEQMKHAGLQDATQSPEYKLFQKTTKMCRFFANTLVHYIKEFNSFLTKYCSSFHQLYLQVISKFPPSLCAPVLPSRLSEELKVAALVPMEALLSQLMPLRPFAEAVLQQDQRFSPECELPQCLLLVSVLGQLASQPEEVLQLWYKGSQFSEETPRLPLFQAVFDSFRRCCVERNVPVLLPGVMMKGQAQSKVTLHHHVCVQLCANVAALPNGYFTMLVRSKHTDTLYGTAELCLHHVLLIAQLVKTCTSECYQLSHLGLLLRRMVFLMTPNHQMELVERFPPSQMENLAVWRHILLRALSHDTCLHIVTDVIALSQKVLTDWQNGGYKLGQVDKVVRTTDLQQWRTEQCVLSALRMATQLWLRMCPNQVQTYPVLQHTLQLLLLISATLVKSLEPQVIVQALVCVAALVPHKCADEVVLAALEFLASLGKVFVPHDSQNQILPRLSSLFGVLLADRSWLLHQHALEAFSHFAEITNHEEVISQSLTVEETKTKLVNYLSKTVNAQEDVESRLDRLKLETPVIKQHNERLETKKETAADKLAAEPCPKRARQETSTEEEYSRYIHTAESALKALQALAKGEASTAAPPPQWLVSRLQELQTLISQISTAQQT